MAVEHGALLNSTVGEHLKAAEDAKAKAPAKAPTKTP